MNSQELKCFVVAADRLNFTRAAKELYVTPPTVTHHIQHLEEELGVKLFIRNSKSVQLTTAGEIFYHDAHDILLRMEETVKRLKAIKTSEQSILKMGCTMQKDTEMLTQALSKFRIEKPHVSPRIYLDDYYQLVNRLLENQLDLIIGTKEMIQDQGSCQFIKLRSISIKALIPQNILRIKENDISLNNLQKYPLITLRQKSVPKIKDDSIEQILSTKMKNVIRLDDERAVLSLILSGYGIGILPEYTFSNNDLDDTIQILDIEESLKMDYGVIYLKNHKSPLIADFIACL